MATTADSTRSISSPKDCSRGFSSSLSSTLVLIVTVGEVAGAIFIILAKVVGVPGTGGYIFCLSSGIVLCSGATLLFIGGTISLVALFLFKRKVEKSKALAEQIEDINAPDDATNTPLHIAAQKGSYMQVTALLERDDIDCDVQNAVGATPLHLAAEGGHKLVVGELLKKGANRALQDHSGALPLHRAAKNGHADTAHQLLSNDNLGLDAVNNKGRTPLHSAAIGGNLDTVITLCIGGADINAEDNSGATPLYYAVLKGHGSVADHLKYKGAQNGTKLNQHFDYQQPTASDTTIAANLKKGRMKIAGIEAYCIANYQQENTSQ